MVQKGIFLVGGIEGEQMIDITFFMHAPPWTDEGKSGNRLPL